MLSEIIKYISLHIHTIILYSINSIFNQMSPSLNSTKKHSHIVCSLQPDPNNLGIFAHKNIHHFSTFKEIKLIAYPLKVLCDSRPISRPILDSHHLYIYIRAYMTTTQFTSTSHTERCHHSDCDWKPRINQHHACIILSIYIYTSAYIVYNAPNEGHPFPVGHTHNHQQTPLVHLIAHHI